MFVSITFHPNRDEWRSLFLTEAEAAADNAAFLAMFPTLPVTARVEPASIDDAAEYVERGDEQYAECRAEAGSGAMSLGYGVDGAYEAANAVEPPSTNPLYVAARAMLRADAEAAAEARHFAMIEDAADIRGFNDFDGPADDGDDIPF